MNKVILADGSALEVETVTFEPHFSIPITNWDAFRELVNKLTEENLKHLQVVVDDQVAATFEDCCLVGTQTINADIGMTAHIYLLGRPGEVNGEYKTAYQIMAGEIEA